MNGVMEASDAVSTRERQETENGALESNQEALGIQGEAAETTTTPGSFLASTQSRHLARKEAPFLMQRLWLLAERPTRIGRIERAKSHIIRRNSGGATT